MKMKLLYLGIFLAVITSCKDALDVYLGVPLQPKFDSDSFTSGLNIFGVIQPDSTQNYNNSFVILQRVIPAVADSGGLEIDTAIVIISNITKDESSCEFTLSNSDSTFQESNYRPTCTFTPIPGEIYSVQCTYKNLPVLTAKTIVPNKPNCKYASIKFANNSTDIEFLPDTTYFMLDIYQYHNSQISGYERIASSKDSESVVSFYPFNEEPDSIVIYSYDYNLSVYYLTSNTSLNFNKYRKSFATVENGYGVFGSMNKLTLTSDK